MSSTFERNQTGPLNDFSARFAALAYGTISYAVFLAVFIYAIGFVSGFWVPKNLDTGAPTTLALAVLVNFALLSAFAIQHSGMARQGFKRLFERFASRAIERSTYVLSASLLLALLFWQWRPIPIIVWQIDNPIFANVMIVGGFVGWLIVLYSTFLISHFELFGLTQVVKNFAGLVTGPMSFKTPGLYKFIRHPIYLGFIIAFWSAPVMTVGHLLFAGVTTAYILVGIYLEERDLIDLFGDEYRRYRSRVAMLFPGVFSDH